MIQEKNAFKTWFCDHMINGIFMFLLYDIIIFSNFSVLLAKIEKILIIYHIVA